MPHPLFKTEIDAARVLLRVGWRPNDINGVLQFPLSEETYRSLGAHSLFFLVSDPLLAEELRPGAKQEAMAVLVAQGWTEIEIEALLKPERKFAPRDSLVPFDTAAEFETLAPGLTSPKAASVKPGRNPMAGYPTPSLTQLEERPLPQYRRSMGLNRLLGLGMVILSVGIDACILPEASGLPTLKIRIGGNSEIVK